MTEQPHWRDKANCLDADPEAFFPIIGNNGVDAKKICARCEVTEECLDYAMRHRIDEGVWGGLSTIDREKMRRRQAA